MLKNIQSFIIVVLAALCIYFYNDRRTATEFLKQKIAALEAASTKEREDREMVVAYLKAEKERELAQEKLKHRGTPTPLFDHLKKLPTEPKKVRSDTLGEMSKAINMDEKQEIQARNILSDFDKDKERVFGKSRDEKRFVFDPVVFERINEVRREAMRKMAGIFSEEQLRTMKEKNFDLKLGIRELRTPDLKP